MQDVRYKAAKLTKKAVNLQSIDRNALSVDFHRKAIEKPPVILIGSPVLLVIPIFNRRIPEDLAMKMPGLSRTKYIHASPAEKYCE